MIRILFVKLICKDIKLSFEIVCILTFALIVLIFTKKIFRNKNL